MLGSFFIKPPTGSFYPVLEDLWWQETRYSLQQSSSYLLKRFLYQVHTNMFVPLFLVCSLERCLFSAVYITPWSCIMVHMDLFLVYASNVLHRRVPRFLTASACYSPFALPLCIHSYCSLSSSLLWETEPSPLLHPGSFADLCHTDLGQWDVEEGIRGGSFVSLLTCFGLGLWLWLHLSISVAPTDGPSCTESDNTAPCSLLEFLAFLRCQFPSASASFICRLTLLALLSVVQMVSNLQCFNLGFFYFMMVQKHYAFRRNLEF